jgi:hypothetical protein
MKQIIKQVVDKQVEQAKDIVINDKNRVMPGESFEAYLKRMALQRKDKYYVYIKS